MPMHLLQRIGMFFLLFTTSSLIAQRERASQWVYRDAQGKLVYKTTERGDKIMDFSYAGYMGGGVALPKVPVQITLNPSEGDNTEAIQNAIDKVSAMPLINGWRGAILLAPGHYSCERTLSVQASGVVLRGSGSGENGSVIDMTGAPHVCIAVKGRPAIQVQGELVAIADAYVPAGSREFNISATPAPGLQTGDTIRLTRPVTDAWLAFMGMDQLVRNGKKETWVSGDITTERVIQKMTDRHITLDMPLSDSYDAIYTAPSGVSIQKISVTGELSQIGVEDLRIVAPSQSVTITEPHHSAVVMNGITDGWISNLAIVNTVNSIGVSSRRVTISHVNITHDVPTLGAAKPADLSANGAQLLFDHCTITGDNLFYFATGAKVTGPIVLLNCICKGKGWIQPHQRWATGLLVDECQVPDGGIDFMNRGEMGSGHGWTIGWAVAWNCRAKSYLNQQPPGAVNWVIGCKGESQKQAMPFDKAPLLPEGIYDAHGTAVNPESLYLAQLAERLGKEAVKQMGY